MDQTTIEMAYLFSTDTNKIAAAIYHTTTTGISLTQAKQTIIMPTTARMPLLVLFEVLSKLACLELADPTN